MENAGILPGAAGIAAMPDGQAAQVPLTHAWLEQSLATLQVLCGSHFGQLPPQSTSVSLPFFAPSLHCELTQVPSEPQTPETQSLALPQSLPLPHLLHSVPPQSLSLSLPLRSPSLQLGAAQ